MTEDNLTPAEAKELVGGNNYRGRREVENGPS